MNLRKFVLLNAGFLLVVINAALGQTTVAGTVKDIKGMPVAGASVFTKDAKKGTSTDSLGAFSINTSPSGTLIISAIGFADTTVSINNQRTIAIVLRQQAATLAAVTVSGSQPETSQLSNETINQQNVQNSLEDYARSEEMGAGVKTFSSPGMGGHDFHIATTSTLSLVNYNGMMPVLHQPVETKGSRFLMSDWSGGLVVNQFDTVVNNPTYLFNYDKITGDLLMTQDKQTYIEIDRPQIKSFALKDKSSGYVFVHVPLIDKGDGYFLLLGQGTKYGAYKSIKTKLVKANGVSTGLTSVGNDYDEYVDEEIYYFADLKNGTVKQFELKKKSVKDAIPGEKDKVDKYFTDHKKDDVNDHFIAGLVNFLNKQ